MPVFNTSVDFAKHLDQNDALASCRSEFFYADENIIYLDGNSLGRLPLKSKSKLDEVINLQWGERLIRSWNEKWLDMPKKAAHKIAGIIGAEPEEVLICDSTSINLYKLVLAALHYQPDRKSIVSDELNFPSDLYIFQGVVRLFKDAYQLKLVGSSNGIKPDLNHMKDLLDNDTALAAFSHVLFKSGYMYDVKAVTEIVHSAGALTLWDLSHSVGVVPIKLNEWNVDFAVGCTYKYLNGGPGSSAFLYIRRDLIVKMENFISGWFGHSNPFGFDLRFNSSDGIEKFNCGTSNILSIASIEPSLDIITEAGIDSIRKKSVLQTDYLIYLVKERLKKFGFEIGSPFSDQERGSHVSLRHNEGYRICKALINSSELQTNVIPDFRMPDNIRIGISPLYNSFVDIYSAVEAIEYVLANKLYERYNYDNEKVT
ncbi:MAG: kynureninase [Melioribacteraceae bacterium]|nr:kynureninase [Melioribacteraceae bacterium]